MPAETPATLPHLSASNDHWHQIFDIRYRQFLESVTALELDDARRDLQFFNRLLAAHIEFEDLHLAGIELDDPAARKLVDADHLILRRLMQKCEAAFDAVEAAANRRAELVNRLNEFMRLHNVLSHHDEREKVALYPAVEEAITPAQSRRLGRLMDEAMGTVAGDRP